MIIDAHCHVGIDKDGQRLTLEALKKSMNDNGIDKAIIFPFDDPEGTLEASLKLLKYRSGNIIPFLRFDPKTMKAKRLKELLITGFSGVKLHPRSQDFNPLDKRYLPLYKEMADSGKPLIIHTRKEDNPNTDPDNVVKLADMVPGLNIIIAHFAMYSATAIEQMKKHRNLYIETSIMSSNTGIRLVAEKIGADKVIFGSDIPYSDQEIELLKIKKSGLGKQDIDRILYRNMAKLADIG